MYFCTLLMRHALRLVTLSLIVVLAGCGSISSPPSPHLSKSTVTPSPAARGGSDTSTTSFPPANTVNDFDIPNLLHISPEFMCGVNYRASNTLVLSDNRLTYKSSEIQQMLDYFRGGKVLPPTLQWVSGFPVDQSESKCGENLKITNISSTTIQLSQMNIRLTASPQPNHVSYHVINSCSFMQPDSNGFIMNRFCNPTGGGQRVYESDYSLGPEKANTVFPGQFHITDESGASIPSLPTLNQGDVATIYLTFTTHAIPSNFTYSITPELVLNEGNTESRVNLDKLSTTIAFVGKDQVTCYNLKGDTFIPTVLMEGSGTLGPSDTVCI